MPDRLDDLRRQRALVQEQLAWLDREIAAQSSSPARPAQPSTLPVAPATLPATPEEAYEPDPAAAGSDARRGCIVTVALALLLLGVVLVAVYFIAYRDHPLLFAR